jgi:hypothetical protein
MTNYSNSYRNEISEKAYKIHKIYMYSMSNSLAEATKIESYKSNTILYKNMKILNIDNSYKQYFKCNTYDYKKKSESTNK